MLAETTGRPSKAAEGMATKTLLLATVGCEGDTAASWEHVTRKDEALAACNPPADSRCLVLLGVSQQT